MAQRRPFNRKTYKAITGYKWHDSAFVRSRLYDYTFMMMPPMRAPDYALVGHCLAIMDTEPDWQIKNAAFDRMIYALASYQAFYHEEDMASVFEKLLSAIHNPRLADFQPRLMEVGVGMMAEGYKTVNTDFFDLAVRYYRNFFAGGWKRAEFFTVPLDLMLAAVKNHEQLVTLDFRQMCCDFYTMPYRMVPFGKPYETPHEEKHRERIKEENDVIRGLQNRGYSGMGKADEIIEKRKRSSYALLPSPPQYPLLTGPSYRGPGH